MRGGWAAVASVPLVAKRAALPKLYLKPERTALWTVKGDSQNVEWINRKDKPELETSHCWVRMHDNMC